MAVWLRAREEDLINPMRILSAIYERLRFRQRPWWNHFEVSFDDHKVTVREERGWRKVPSEQVFEWTNVRRVCFKDRGLSSDVFYIHTSDHEKPFMVPTEAQGGEAFWTALRERGLFPEVISAAAVRSTDGGFYCWPPGDEAEGKNPEK